MRSDNELIKELNEDLAFSRKKLDRIVKERDLMVVVFVLWALYMFYDNC